MFLELYDVFLCNFYQEHSCLTITLFSIGFASAPSQPLYNLESTVVLFHRRKALPVNVLLVFSLTESRLA